MDAMHEKGIKAFPAKTAGLGNQLMAPKIVNGVKVFELTAKKIQWETEPGHLVEAWAYNDQVPGPQIRVTEGDRVRVDLAQRAARVYGDSLSRPRAAERHGRRAVHHAAAGEARPVVHVRVHGAERRLAHVSLAPQLDEAGRVSGCSARSSSSRRRRRPYDHADVDQVIVLNDGSHGYTFNGKSFPATQPIVAKLGQKVRIRFMNEGMMIHPMHLHGMHMTVIAKDGWPVPAPWKCDTLNIAPGERWDVIVNCNNPGTWAFHCHILPHAESEHGMFGMVTALVVQK